MALSAAAEPALGLLAAGAAPVALSAAAESALGLLAAGAAPAALSSALRLANMEAMEAFGLAKRFMRAEERAQGGCGATGGMFRSSSSSAAWSDHLGGSVEMTSQDATCGSRPGLSSA